MYEQSFRYLSRLLTRWLKDRAPVEGDRFYVQFEDAVAVRALCAAFDDCASSKLDYDHDFSAPVIDNDPSPIVVVGSQMGDKAIQGAFLTKLRNDTAAQIGGFQGKCLLIIDHTGLDSIVDGGESLAKEERPLHAESLRRELTEDIRSSSLHKGHKEALTHLLQGMRQSTHEDTSSVFAYIPFMNALASGSFSTENWNELGLFEDSELTAISGQPLQKRVDENAKLFELVRNSHQYGVPGEDLQKTFTPAGVTALKADEWMRQSFSRVLKWHSDKRDETPATFIEVEKLPLGGDPEIWERNEGDTAAASRTRHIIVFNPNLESSTSLTLLFDDTLLPSGISHSQKPRLAAKAIGRKLQVDIPDCSQNCVIDRVEYKGRTGGATVFNIAVVPFASSMLLPHKTTYLVNGATRTRRIRLYEEGNLVFNPTAEKEERFDLGVDASPYTIRDDARTVIQTDNADPDNDVQFELSYNDVLIPCELYRERAKPRRISGVTIWKLKRERQRSFEYPGPNKLVFGTDEYFTDLSRTNRFLEYERQIIQDFANDCFWVLDGRKLCPWHLDLNGKLRSAYQALTAYYKKNSLLPSLAHVTPELQELMKECLTSFTELFEQAKEDELLPVSLANLMRVGTIETASGEDAILLTPLHPLVIAYQLEFLSQGQTEDIPEEILRCLSPASLVPYLNDPRGTATKYCAVRECDLAEWLVYKPHNSFNRGWHDEYVEALIAEKISEYTRHFRYFFTGSSKAPIRINLVNMGDCTDALKGIIRYFLGVIANPPDGDVAAISPVELRIYGGNSHANRFEAFARYANAVWIERDFEISLAAGDCSSADVLAILQEKLHFYLKPADSQPEYAHLTFFRFSPDSIEWIYHKMDAIRTGASLQGLTSAVPSVFRQSQYLTGYGTRDYPPEPSSLLNFAEKYNAIARIAFTQQPYSASEATFSALKATQKEQLDHLYNVSNWITLIDPKVDLNFFKMHEEAGNLVIIHYSDQYNNTSGYDAITVTRKCHHYQAIIKEFLKTREVESRPEVELELINMFNALNGDWLLRLIAGRRHFSKEKVSILSAVRTMLAFLRHKDITWVPLSLEEVLRVSGSVGLSKGDGLFSVKNLSQGGIYCDDLLMAGIERDGGKVRVHLLPVEVKIGQNSGSVIEKAKKQGLRTAQLLRDFLTPDPDCFRARFYRGFFAKMILVGADKMSLYNVFPEADWTRLTDDSRAALLNDDFEIDWTLDTCLARCAAVSFRDDTIQRSAKIEDEVLLLDMPGQDGHRNLLKSVAELANAYNDPGQCTINRQLLLCNCYKSAPPAVASVTPNMPDTSAGNAPKPPANGDVPPDSPPPPEPVTKPAKGMEILFGHEVNYNEPVVWHPNDTNKVMHTNTGIIGTMGTGKTQFTKSLIAQMVWEAKNNVNGTKLGILIFDYKGDYIKDDFVQATGAKRFDLHKLPYNPLALTVGDGPQPMLPLHTANAIKESIATAFGLGVVQKQKLRDMIMDAYTLRGIDKGDKSTWSCPAPTLADMCRLYLDSDDAKQDSLYAAIDNLYQFEIFEPKPENTVSLWDLLDGVVVINLSGYSQDIQNLVVAITLDLFYSQMQKTGHSAIQGNLRELRKMVLVDEADNFLSQDFAALRKILKEGREFGVGTILSTQFLNHFSTAGNEYSNYILTWVVHRVNEIGHKDVAALFDVTGKEQAQHLMSEIKGLQKHFSIAALADGKPTMIRDRAFWEIVS